MFIGLLVAVSVFITACIAKALYVPQDPAEKVEDYIFRKYGIDIEQLPKEDDTEYEIIIDRETGRRVIREKTKEPNPEAQDDSIPDFVYCPCDFCLCAL